MAHHDGIVSRRQYIACTGMICGGTALALSLRYLLPWNSDGPGQLVRQHTGHYFTQVNQQAIQSLEPLEREFERARRGADQFADAALGLWSKWYVARDHLPFTDGVRHEQWLKGEFERLVLSEAGLKRALEQSVRRHLEALQDAEDQMLLQLRADLATEYPDLPVSRLTSDQFRGQFESSMKVAAAHARKSVVTDAAQFANSAVISSIITRILTRVLTRVAVSAGTLGAGAAGGAWSFGITFLLALIIDAMISRIWNWWSDPKGRLAGELQANLTELYHQIVYGPQGNDGLYHELREINRERHRLLETTLDQMISGDGT